jgi:hypothetical protein
MALVNPINYAALAQEGAANQQAMQMRQQQAQQQAAVFQQAQQDRQRQWAALGAAGTALPQLLSPPPPQAPAPGQASQPAMQYAPQPRQVPLGGQQMPQQPPMPPPFRPMPSAPPGMPGVGQPSAIAPPPQAAQQPAQQQAPSGPMTLDQAVKALQSQGLQGADLMAGLQQIMPLLDSQAKQQATQATQQFSQEMQMARLGQTQQTHADTVAHQASVDRATAAYRQSELGLRAAAIDLKKQQIAAGQGDDAKFSSEDLDFLAEQARTGDTSVYQNLGRGAQGAKNIVALRKRVMEQEKKAGGSGATIAAKTAEYQGVKAGERALGTRTAQVGMAVNEAQQFIEVARNASREVSRTQFVPANRALQSFQTNTGDPKIVAYGASINSLVNAYSRAISPTGTPTVSDKEHAREMLNTAHTQEQFDAVTKIMQQEMGKAQQSPGAVRQEFRQAVTGGAPDRLTPSAGPAIGDVEGGYKFKGGDPSKSSSWVKQ